MLRPRLALLVGTAIAASAAVTALASLLAVAALPFQPALLLPVVALTAAAVAIAVASAASVTAIASAAAIAAMLGPLVTLGGPGRFRRCCRGGRGLGAEQSTEDAAQESARRRRGLRLSGYRHRL